MHATFVSPEDVTLFALDADELDTELDAVPWGRPSLERHERERLADLVRSRHETLARAARSVDGRSLAALVTALGHVAAFGGSDRHAELFGKTGLLGGYLSAVYAAAHDGVTARPLRLERVDEEHRRLASVADALPEDVRAALLETFAAFDRFAADLAD